MNLNIDPSKKDLIQALGLPEAGVKGVATKVTDMIHEVVTKDPVQLAPGVQAVMGNTAEIAKMIQERFDDSEIMFLALQQVLQTMESLEGATLIKHK